MTNKSVRSRPKSKDRFRRVSRRGCTGSRSPRKLATRNSLARQTGRSRQTRSARVRETFRLCPGGEQSTSCSLSEAFFSSRLDGRVERAFMLLSSLVATQAPPPEDRQFLSRPRTKNQRAILISLFCYVRGNPGRIAFIVSHIIHVFILDLCFQFVSKKRCDPWLFPIKSFCISRYMASQLLHENDDARGNFLRRFVYSFFMCVECVYMENRATSIGAAYVWDRER